MVPTDAHAISVSDWPTFRRLMADYRSGRLGGKPPGQKHFQPAGRPNIRVILLDDLEFGASVSAAVTEPEQSNEIQRIEFQGTVTGGTFKLTFDGETTEDIDYDATSGEVRTALEALSNINSGDVDVEAYEGLYVVQFTGQYAGQDVPLISVESNSLLGVYNTIITANTIWEDSGRTETVYGILPVGSPTPLRSGATALAHWYHGLGYAVHAAECRDLDWDPPYSY